MVRCVNLRHYKKNTLQGFVDLELSNAGLVLRDCTWHALNNKEWVAFPARSYEGDDGVQRWQPLVEFAVGAAREQFRRQAIAAIHTFAEQNMNAVP